MTKKKTKIDEEIAQISHILKTEKQTLSLIAEAKERAVELIQAGHNIPGYGVEKKLTNRKWTKGVNPDKLHEVLKRFIPRKGDLVETKIKSPAGIEKMLLEIPEAREIIQEFTVREENGFRLVKLDD